MRKVQWFVLSAVCVAGASQAQSLRVAPSLSDSREERAEQAAQAESRELRVSPRLRMHKLTDDEISSYLEADQMDGSPDSRIVLTGNAQVRRIDTVLKGDRIDYNRNTGDINTQGSARLLRDGTLVTAPSLVYNVDNETGQIENPNFWMGASGGFARAEHGDIFSRSTMRLSGVTYSGCDCEVPSWYIKSRTLDLDFDENEGIARNGVLYFKDVPLLASPYLTFPIKKERKSGLLLPTYGLSSNSGFEYAQPYYLNLAPNYDATITPRILSKRGVQLGAEFRYLQPTYNGVMSGTYLQSDRETGEARWLFSSRHNQVLGGGFTADWDINRVSDDDYFRDFSTIGLNEASRTYLPSTGGVNWASRYIQTRVSASKYQTLQDLDAPILPQYDKLPELSLRAARYNWGGFDTEMDVSAIRFSRPKFQGQRFGQNGDRLTAYPTISFPVVRSSWYVTPKFGVHATQYQGTERFGGNPNALTDPSMYRRSDSRTLPIGSVDAGMTFERDASLFGKSAVQTLEPRLYYLYVPYRDQSRMPVYDTSLADFSFLQAFQENIYSGGWDRISNANQLTAALTTRWLDADTGFERLSLSAAQRLYFADQRVTLPGETPRENVRSDYLVGATAALTDTLSTELAAQYNPYESQVSRVLASTRWRPQRLTSVTLSYRYQRDPTTNIGFLPVGQNQVSLAFQWPFTNRIYGIGRIDYSLGRDTPNTFVSDPDQYNSRITQAIAGLEYKGDCCWTGRVVFQRYAVAAQQENTALFFQLELNGLGALGTDPMGLLSRSISGYQSVNPSTPAGTSFERYE
ncbi:LPS-assembly protein LptD [Alcaligenaceae bacterium A4P071]|nr:LPS-assembly protein LptD [Alcaligenaceae bacterium C4P045]MDQ2185147.1 LPS-assembly protein LptD [Alcaligenaceae bacterium A4P071]